MVSSTNFVRVKKNTVTDETNAMTFLQFTLRLLENYEMKSKLTWNIYNGKGASGKWHNKIWKRKAIFNFAEINTLSKIFNGFSNNRSTIKYFIFRISVGLLIIVIITMLVLRMRGGKEDVSGFAGVDDMDPQEAYVQQLIAQGYPEDTARQYAQQYAGHFQDQK